MEMSNLQKKWKKNNKIVVRNIRIRMVNLVLFCFACVFVYVFIGLLVFFMPLGLLQIFVGVFFLFQILTFDVLYRDTFLNYVDNWLYDHEFHLCHEIHQKHQNFFPTYFMCLGGVPFNGNMEYFETHNHVHFLLPNFYKQLLIGNMIYRLGNAVIVGAFVIMSGYDFAYVQMSLKTEMTLFGVFIGSFLLVAIITLTYICVIFFAKNSYVYKMSL